MRTWFVLAGLAIGCQPPPTATYAARSGFVVPGAQPLDPRQLGKLDNRLVDFAFEGGQIEFEMFRDNGRVVQTARNRYAVPIVISWSITALENLEPRSAMSGVAFLPAAASPLGPGEPVRLAQLQQIDSTQRYHRVLAFRARFGDPRAVPEPYVYGLPYPLGLTFAVLQGFHGEFSHKGSNEFAIDFDCPVSTPVVATRPGVVVVRNSSAQGGGTTPEFLDYKRTNFVMVRHDDGTLGEYMHLAPSGVVVEPGERVERGQELAKSGNSGFSSTPHLHFQVMTAGDDGISAHSFPFQFAVAPKKVEEPVQGRRYAAWE